MRINKKIRPRNRVNVFVKKGRQLVSGSPVLLTRVGSNTFCGIDNNGLERIFDFRYFRPAKIKK